MQKAQHPHQVGLQSQKDPPSRQHEAREAHLARAAVHLLQEGLQAAQHSCRSDINVKAPARRHGASGRQHSQLADKGGSHSCRGSVGLRHDYAPLNAWQRRRCACKAYEIARHSALHDRFVDFQLAYF